MPFEIKFALIAITILIALTAVNVLLVFSLNEKFERALKELKDDE